MNKSPFDPMPYIARDPNDSEDSPADYTDIIYANESTARTIDAILTKKQPFPSVGQSALLLYGPPGTGKTSLAFHLFDHLMPGQAIQRYKAVPGPDGLQLAKHISRPDGFVRITSGPDAYLIDEVDNFSKSALKVFKNGMDDPQKLFVLTTNNLHVLDKVPGFVSRCILLEMPAANYKQLYPLAEQILSEEGCTNYDVATVERELRKANGDIRTVYREMRRYARDKAALTSKQLHVVKGGAA